MMHGWPPPQPLHALYWINNSAGNKAKRQRKERLITEIIAGSLRVMGSRKEREHGTRKREKGKEISYIPSWSSPQTFVCTVFSL